MYIGEWFDPTNIVHLNAWRHLTLKGEWPEGFIPKHVTFFGSWQTSLMAKMAEEWVKTNLEKAGIKY